MWSNSSLLDMTNNFVIWCKIASHVEQFWSTWNLLLDRQNLRRLDKYDVCWWCGNIDKTIRPKGSHRLIEISMICHLCQWTVFLPSNSLCLSPSPSFFVDIDYGQKGWIILMKKKPTPLTQVAHIKELPKRRMINNTQILNICQDWFHWAHPRVLIESSTIQEKSSAGHFQQQRSWCFY